MYSKALIRTLSNGTTWLHFMFVVAIKELLSSKKMHEQMQGDM